MLSKGGWAVHLVGLLPANLYSEFSYFFICLYHTVDLRSPGRDGKRFLKQIWRGQGCCPQGLGLFVSNTSCGEAAQTGHHIAWAGACGAASTWMFENERVDTAEWMSPTVDVQEKWQHNAVCQLANLRKEPLWTGPHYLARKNCYTSYTNSIWQWHALRQDWHVAS